MQTNVRTHLHRKAHYNSAFKNALMLRVYIKHAEYYQCNHATMQPTLVLAEHLQPILKELQVLEDLFHAACKEATPAQFEALVAPDFWEVGATGRLYSREFALAVLTQRPSTPSDDAWKTSDFHLIELGEHNFLLTYTLQQPNRITRRVTAWQRKGSHWQAIYHQGTVVENTEKS